MRSLECQFLRAFFIKGPGFDQPPNPPDLPHIPDMFLSGLIYVYFVFQHSRGFVNEKFYTHPPLLPGEQIISQQDHVTCVDTFDDVTEGILHVTTYRVMFAGCHAQVYHSFALLKYKFLSDSTDVLK